MTTKSLGKNVSLDEFLFVSSYALFMIMNTLRDSFFSGMIGITLYKLAIIGAALILLVKESLLEKSTSRTISQFFLCSFLAFFILNNSSGFGQYSVAYFILYIFCARTIPFQKVVRWSLILSCIALGIVIISSQIGIIQDYVAYDGGRNRHFLGFLYALYPSTILFNIIGLKFLDERITKTNIIVWIIISVLVFWVYIMTNSRTCFAMSVVMILIHVFLLFRTGIENNRFLRVCMVLSILLFAFISIYLIARYDSSVPWQASLNSKLARRLYYGQLSLQENGVKMLGQNINWVGNGLNEYGIQNSAATNWVDCMYVRVLQKYGFIFFSAWLVLMTAAMKKADRNNLSRLMIFCAAVAAHGMLDDLSMYLHYNSSWLLLGMLLMRPADDPVLQNEMIQ